MTLFQGFRYCILGCFLAGLAMPGAAAVADADADRPRVAVIPLKDDIDRPMLFFMRRALQEAKDEGVAAVVIDMHTPGGYVFHVQEIIARMQLLEDIPIYVYVNRDAISGGAIISLATDGIYMAPDGSIGAAAPVLAAGEMSDQQREKYTSVLRAMVRGLANENGYREDVAMAMVDDEIEVKVGDTVVVAKGEMLMMTAQEAVTIHPPMTRPILAADVVDNIEELLSVVEINDAIIITLEPTGAERLANFITMFAPFLIGIGIIGIYMEIKTPGFGIPGIIGITCICIFLFGHFVAGLVGMEDMALILIGLLLISIEIFVIPGFGIVGMLGLLSFFAGVFMAMVPILPNLDHAPDFIPQISIQPFLEAAMLNTSVAIILIAVGAYLVGKYMPKMPLFDGIILQTSTSSADGYVASDVEENSKLIGEEGVTMTPLHPSGIALVNKKRIDVVSDGSFIDKDEPVRVKFVQGPRIVVVPVSASDPSVEKPA